MVFFFWPFWKVFLGNVSYGRQATSVHSDPGRNWNDPFFSRPYSGPSMAGFHVAILPFSPIDGGFE